MEKTSFTVGKEITFIFKDDVHLEIVENIGTEDSYFAGKIIYVQDQYVVLSLSSYSKDVKDFILVPDMVYCNYPETNDFLIENGKYIIVDTLNAMCKYNRNGVSAECDAEGNFVCYPECDEIVPLHHKVGDTLKMFYRQNIFIFVDKQIEKETNCGIIDTKVVYAKNGVIIVKSSEIEWNMDINANAMEYVEAWYLFQDFIDKEAKKTEKFICLDEKSQYPLYTWNINHDGLYETIFDSEHHVSGKKEFLMPPYSEIIAQFNNFKKKYWIQELKERSNKYTTFEERKEEFLKEVCAYFDKNITISVSETDLNTLSAPTEDDEKKKDIRECNLPRLQRWFNEKDCAIMTTWRNGQTQKVKSSNNKDLQTELRSYNYGVVKVEGRYPEIGKEFGRERSFLVVNLMDDKDFYDRIYSLSAYYKQDSFLYKPKDDLSVYLIGTNDDFISKNGKKVRLGAMVVNKMEEEIYTKVKGGRISFVQSSE